MTTCSALFIAFHELFGKQRWGYNPSAEMCVCQKMRRTDSHVVEDTPATVGVTGAQTLGTCTVLLAGLHRDLSHLKQRNDREG